MIAIISASYAIFKGNRSSPWKWVTQFNTNA